METKQMDTYNLQLIGPFFVGGAKLFNLFFFEMFRKQKTLVPSKQKFPSSIPTSYFSSPSHHGGNPVAPDRVVPPLKDLNRFQVAVPDNKPRAELDGFRVKIRSRSLVKNKVEPLRSL